MRGRSLRFAAAAGAICVIAAGCGGGTARLSKAEYAAKLRAAGASMDQSITANYDDAITATGSWEVLPLAGPPVG